MTCPSFTMSVCHVTSLSVILPAPTVCPLPHPHVTPSVHHTDMSVCRTTHQSVCQAIHQSVTLSVHTTASPSIIPIHTSYAQSVQHPVNSSMTCPSVTPPVSLKICPSDHLSLSDHLYTILPHPSGCPTSSDCLYDNQPSLSDHPSPPDCLYDKPLSLSACLSLSDCLTTTTTRLPICPSSQMIHRTQDSSQPLAVMNGEQSHKSKKFHRAFNNYDLLLCALDASSIYLCDSRHVAPPKSGEDAQVTCGRCDLGGTSLNKPSLGFSYVLPRLWDHGGVRSTPNVTRD